MRRHKPAKFDDGVRDAAAILDVGIIERHIEIGEIDKGSLATGLADDGGRGRGELPRKGAAPRRSGINQDGSHCASPVFSGHVGLYVCRSGKRAV